MTCKEVADFLMAYLDMELSDAEKAHFEKHLATCPSCVCYIESYKKTVKLGKDACKDGGCGEVPDGLIKAILEARAKGGRK